MLGIGGIIEEFDRREKDPGVERRACSKWKFFPDILAAVVVVFGESLGNG